jgi:hypothetical protein
VALKTVIALPDKVIDLLAASTAELFNGPNVSMVESMLKQAHGIRGDDHHHYAQEIIVNSDNLIHVFLRGKQNQEHIIVFVCRNTVSLGMALTQARIALPAIETAVGLAACLRQAAISAPATAAPSCA